MIKRHIYILSLFAILFSACNEEEVLNSYTDLVKISTHIESHGTNLRANIGNDGKGSFTENDQISLLISPEGSNYQISSHNLTFTNQEWTPSLSWSNIQLKKALFSAFYPTIATNESTDFIHKVSLNQDKGKEFEQSDLLHASTTVNQGEEVALNFKHLMSCLTIQLTGDAYSDEELANAKITVWAYNQIKVNKDGTLGYLLNYDHGVNPTSQITFKNQGHGIYQVIMCPQEIMDSWKITTSIGWIDIHIGGKIYPFHAPEKLQDGTSFKELEPGKTINMKIRINQKGEVDTEFSDQTRWVYGISGMPDVADWKYFDAITKFKGLPWKSEYGWYDCNKVSTELPGDMNLCWAASSANIIHWWLDQNQAYLDRCKYNGPRAYNNHLESEVFQAFKDNFIDEGYFEFHGLNWFFQGGPVNQEQLKNKNSGGYFKHVFHKSLVENVAITNFDSLNKTLKRALDNKQAITFSILMEGFGSAHAMTIWGAEFDKQGNVCAIYYTDNNDRSAAEQAENQYQVPAGMLVAKVGTLNGNAAMEGSTHKISIPIRTLTLLDLGQDQWEAYFKE